jgi:hypothetical protein
MGELMQFPQVESEQLILTSSEMATWQSCQRGWYITYYLRLRPIRQYTSPLSVGSLYHEGLEAFYRGVLDDPAMFIANKAGELVTHYPEAETQIVKDVELASIMLQGYMEWIETEGADVGLEIVGVEQSVEQPVGPYILRGKIDARIRREWDGALLQLEHKTVGNLADIPKYAQSAPQFLTYDLLAALEAKNGEEDVRTDGVLLNMARKVKRSARANPPFYGRFEVRHNADELNSHYRHVITLGNAIKDARESLDQDWSHHEVVVPNVGRDHSWRCVCREVTHLFDDGSDPDAFLNEFFESHDPWERYNEEENV